MLPKKPLENLSKRERESTPLAFACYLLARVLALTGAQTVAVLWTQRRSNWQKLWPLVDCWGRQRNANLYPGPYPIIAHPPCGPWGKYRSVCKQSVDDGIRAMELVHRYHGCVEQPSGSALFMEHGREGGNVEVICQGDWGHPAQKSTLLYWF